MRIVDLLEEEQETKSFMEVMNEFLPFVTKELDLPGLPKIKLEARLGSAEHHLVNLSAMKIPFILL